MSDRSPSEIVRSPLTWIAVIVALAIIGGGIYWQAEREKTRQRIELERVAAEKAEQARVKEAEEKREREKMRVVEEMRELKEAEEKQRLVAMEARREDTLNKQFVAGERPEAQSALQTSQMAYDQRRREYDRYREQYQAQEDQYRARQEVERQKRYVQQREYEEQAARQQRDYKARYGN